MILYIGGFADVCPLLSPLTMTNTNTSRRPRLPRTMADLASHPWVESISDERSMREGIWVYLKPGYLWDGDVGCIHEDTVKACCRAMRFVYFDQAVQDELEAVPAPVEAAPVEAAPVEAAPVEVAPVEVAPVAVPLPTLIEVRREASNRGMQVHRQRRHADKLPWYHVCINYWNGENLQEKAGDKTPEVHCLEGIDALKTWASVHMFAPIEAAPIEAAPIEAAPIEAAPIEAAPVEAAPVEAAPVEAAPVEVAPVEVAPVEVAIGRWLDYIARAVAAAAVAVYAAGLTMGAAVHALNDWLAGVAPLPAPAPASVAPPAVHPFAVITAAALDGLSGAAVAVAL